MIVLSVKALSSGSDTTVSSPQFVTVERLLFFCVLSSVVVSIASATTGAIGEAMLPAAMPDELGIFLAVEGFSSSNLAEAEVRFFAAREF